MGLKHYVSGLFCFLIAYLQLATVEAFYFKLNHPALPQQASRRCFTYTFNQQLPFLIQADFPIFKKDLSLSIQISKRNGYVDKELVLNQTIKQAKFKHTFNKQQNDKDTKQNEKQASLKYQVCLLLKNIAKISPRHSDQIGSTIIGSLLGEQTNEKHRAYLVSLNFFNSFTHVLKQKRLSKTQKIQEYHYTKQNLQQLTANSQKLLALAKQQTLIHQKNEKMEMETQKNVKAIQDEIYGRSLFQSILLVLGSLMHINLLKSYLKSNKII